jgi:hypothetical protein
MGTSAMFDWATPHSRRVSGNRRRRLVASISMIRAGEKSRRDDRDYELVAEDRCEPSARRLDQPPDSQ